MNFRNLSYTGFPRFHFDEAATGAGSTSSPGAGSVAQPSAPSSTPAAPASTPAPASTQTPTPGSDSPATAQPSSDPFSGLDGGWDASDDLDEIVIADAPGTAPGAPPLPAAAPAAPATPPVPPAPAAAPAADPAAAAPAPAPAATPASSRERLDQTIDGFKANQAELSAWAGTNLFALSDEEAEALATNAAEAVPRLMGKVYTQALAAAGNLMRNFIPQMIEQMSEQQNTTRTRATEAVSEFYTKNSDLNEKDHGALVNQWAKSFRQANPKATRAEAIDFVARAVRVQAGMTAPAPAAQTTRQAPFTPARPGGRNPAPASEHDPYAGLGQDFDEQ